MNKLTIPALLLGVVMVAGAFAFMPVEQASTVHATAATTLSTANIALIADEMLEIREVTNTDVVYDPAQAITITGAASTDEFTVLALIVKPGTGGDPVDATDEIRFDGLTVDGAIGLLVATGTAIDITANGYAVISLADITTPTGNVIGIELSDGTAPPGNTESLSVTVKILIRDSAANPVITIE